MRGFINQYRILLATICLVLLGLHLSTSALNKGESTGRIGRFLITVYTPIHGILSWPFKEAALLAQSYIILVDVKETNRKLKHQNDGLLYQNARLQEIEHENEELRRLLNFPIKPPAVPIFAEVIARSLSQESRTLLINKGARDGLKKKMMALAPEGVIGHVSEVSENSAKILLITDATSVADAVVERTRAAGLVKGKGTWICSMDFIQRLEDVEVGDVVISSGLGGVFEKGYVLGNVTHVDNESNDMFKYIEVTPAAKLDTVEFVIVIPGSQSDAEVSPTESKTAP